MKSSSPPYWDGKALPEGSVRAKLGENNLLTVGEAGWGARAELAVRSRALQVPRRGTGLLSTVVLPSAGGDNGVRLTPWLHRTASSKTLGGGCGARRQYFVVLQADSICHPVAMR